MIHDQALAHLQPADADENRQRQQLALAGAARQIIGPDPDLESALKKLRGVHRETPSPSPLDLQSLLTVDTHWHKQANQLYAALQVNPADEDVREQLAGLLLEQIEQMIDGGQIDQARQVIGEWYVKLDRHPLLQTPHYYLAHGYKVAAHLPKTDLKYTTSLMEPYAYNLAWRMRHTDDITVKLKVEGDLVRITARLPTFEESLSADIRRNLLQATGGAPLCRVYRKPDGEHGLMIVALAAWLTPELLGQLIRSLACRVDLQATHLQSLTALQSVIGKCAPDLSLRAGAPPTERDFKRWQDLLLAQCRQMDLECTIAGDFDYRLTPRAARGEPIRLGFQGPVVTFQARIGDRYRLDRSLYERMMGWNVSAQLGKLTLTPDHAVSLCCEVLDLADEETLSRAVTTMLNGLVQCEALLAWHML
jgi:hypothetical protein